MTDGTYFTKPQIGTGESPVKPRGERAVGETVKPRFSNTKTIFSDDNSIYLHVGGRSMTSVDSVSEKIKGYGYVDFKPVANEEWSIYSLKDETILKLKTVPLKFLRKDDGYLINSMVLATPFSPSALKEDLSTPLPATENMKFDIIGEPWNEYELDDGSKVSIKTVAASISRTTKRDDAGEPLYQVTQVSLVQKLQPVL